MDIMIKIKVHSVLLFSPKSGTEVLSCSKKTGQKKKKVLSSKCMAHIFWAKQRQSLAMSSTN